MCFRVKVLAMHLAGFRFSCQFSDQVENSFRASWREVQASWWE